MKTRHTLGFLLLVATVVALAVVPSKKVVAQEPQTQLAQPMDDMDHSSAPDVVIDGSETPDSITDRAAYRVFLTTFAAGKKSTQFALDLQANALTPAFLSAEDATTASEIFSDFRESYDALLKDHDDVAKQNIQPDEDAFRNQRNQLVSSIIVRLNTELSKTGAKKLNSLIQTEKSKMRISIAEEGQ